MLLNMRITNTIFNLRKVKSMNDEQIENLWSWVMKNFKIECEERKCEIITTAKQLYTNIDDKEKKKDFHPQATILSCLIIAELFYLKSCEVFSVRQAAKFIVVDVRQVLQRIPFLQKYAALPLSEIDTWETITTDSDINFDKMDDLIEIPPIELDAEYGINIHTIHFAGELLGIPQIQKRLVRDDILSSRFIAMAYNPEYSVTVKFVALSQGLLFSNQDITQYGNYAGDLLEVINKNIKQRNSPIPFYAMALNARSWG
jgi:hypothetical protein